MSAPNATYLSRLSRAGGNPVRRNSLYSLDPRLRGDDEMRKIIAFRA
jgi:hypothetical protein